MSAWTGKIDSWNALCIPAWLYAVVIAATLGCGDSGTETVDIPAEGPSEPLIQTDPSAQELSLHPSMKDRPYDASIREIVEREDPAIDGWESEQVSELASKQFKLLGQAILDQAILESESKKLCTEESINMPQARRIEKISLESLKIANKQRLGSSRASSK